MKKGGNPIPSPGQHRDVRRGRGEPGVHRVRPGRKPLLRRLRRRHDPARRADDSAPGRLDVPERPHLDVGLERLGAGREGRVERRRRRGRRRDADAQRHHLREGPGYARRLGRPLPVSNCTRFKADGRRRRRDAGANGSVVFEVYAGATKVFDSGVMNGATRHQAGRRLDRGREPAAARRHERRRQHRLRPRRLGARASRVRWRRRRLRAVRTGGQPDRRARTPRGHDGRPRTAIRLDLVAANAGASTASVWLGNGNGTFGTRADFTTGLTPKRSRSET